MWKAFVKERFPGIVDQAVRSSYFSAPDRYKDYKLEGL